MKLHLVLGGLIMVLTAACGSDGGSSAIEQAPQDNGPAYGAIDAGGAPSSVTVDLAPSASLATTPDPSTGSVVASQDAQADELSSEAVEERAAATPASVATVPGPAGSTENAETSAEEPDAATVIYDAGEFSPKRLDIEVGQAVRFVNESGDTLWPASNIHPTHQIFPEFDAGGPLASGEAWSFTFNKAGFWRYHNHMASADSGIVVVKGQAGAPASPIVVADPEDIDFRKLDVVSVQDAIDLFRNDDLLRRFVKDYGPTETIRVLSENASRVNVACHERAHVAGRIAYELFGAVAFYLAGHECQAGAYHGATEALFFSRGTSDLLADVSAICSQDLNRFFLHQCIHGVGHGLMAWTSYEMLDALELCDGLDTDQDRLSCYSGVFMENVVGGLSGSMGHTSEYLSDDLHFPCNVVEQRHVVHCYYYQTSRMLQLSGGDFQVVAKGCADAPEVAHVWCFLSMGRDVGGHSRGRPDYAVELCSYVEDRDNFLHCIGGKTQDLLWDIGSADEALAFCGLLQGDDAKGRCYSVISERALHLFDPAGLDAFCSRFEEPHRAICPWPGRSP